jgi:hypothetical protein
LSHPLNFIKGLRDKTKFKESELWKYGNIVLPLRYRMREVIHRYINVSFTINPSSIGEHSINEKRTI